MRTAVDLIIATWLDGAEGEGVRDESEESARRIVRNINRDTEGEE